MYNQNVTVISEMDNPCFRKYVYVLSCVPSACKQVISLFTVADALGSRGLITFDLSVFYFV